jgi:hypothetical protein
MKKRIVGRITLLCLLVLLAISASQQESLGQAYPVPGSGSDYCGGGCVNFDDGSPGCASYGMGSTGSNCAMYWWPGFGLNECRQSSSGCDWLLD